jgi:hypothetical protein
VLPLQSYRTPQWAVTPGHGSIMESYFLPAASKYFQYFIPTLGKAHSVQRRGYWVDKRGVGVRFPVGVRNFSFFNYIRTISEVHPTSYPIRTGVLFPRVVKRQEPEAVLSRSSNDEVKNEGAASALSF